MFLNKRPRYCGDRHNSNSQIHRQACFHFGLLYPSWLVPDMPFSESQGVESVLKYICVFMDCWLYSHFYIQLIFKCIQETGLNLDLQCGMKYHKGKSLSGCQIQCSWGDREVQNICQPTTFLQTLSTLNNRARRLLTRKPKYLEKHYSKGRN